MKNYCQHCGAAILRINSGAWVDIKGSEHCEDGKTHSIRTD